MGILMLVTFAVWIGSELWIALRERGTLDTSQDKHTKLIFAACAAAAIVVGIYAPRPPSLTIHWARRFVEVLGFLTIYIGVGIRVASVLALGNSFRTTVMVQKGQQLITTGLYKTIRHPSYLGTLLSVFGLGLASDNWLILLLAMSFMFYGVWQRIRVEEEVMERNFKEYRAYKERTWKLIPRLY